MKLFIDSANLEEIKQAASWGIIDGVTTNPSLIAKEGRDFKATVLEICRMIDGPISAEVMSADAAGMVKEGRELAKWHKNVHVKVPCTEEGIKAVVELTKLKIKTNVTLVFSAAQILLAAKAGATLISPFVGRLDDIGQNGMEVIEKGVKILKNYPDSAMARNRGSSISSKGNRDGFKSELLVASVRSVAHAERAAELGAQIATVPFKVLREMFRHQLTDAGVKKFEEDWKRVKSESL